MHIRYENLPPHTKGVTTLPFKQTIFSAYGTFSFQSLNDKNISVLKT